MKAGKIYDELLSMIAQWDKNGLNDADDLIKSFQEFLHSHMKYTGTYHADTMEEVYAVSDILHDFIRPDVEEK